MFKIFTEKIYKDNLEVQASLKLTKEPVEASKG